MTSQSADVGDPEAGGEFWRRTPPALFPILMGLMGLGLAWRGAAFFAPDLISPWISTAILLFCGVLQLFILGCYLAKFGARPRVLFEDMASVPGRAGISALTVGLFLLAAALLPWSSILTRVVLFIALPIHCVTTVFALFTMARTENGLVVSPAWHLSFVGFIVAALAAVPLGYLGLGKVILFGTILAAAVIYGVSLLQMSKIEVAAPVRPLLAIHLAPLSLFATVAGLLEMAFLALVFASLAMGVAGLLLSRSRFLVTAGFSPLWGAFTFPIAALCTALLTLSPVVPFFGWLAFAPLILASVVTPIIAFLLLRMWSTGALATKTGAAIA